MKSGERRVESVWGVKSKWRVKSVWRVVESEACVESVSPRVIDRAG